MLGRVLRFSIHAADSHLIPRESTHEGEYISRMVGPQLFSSQNNRTVHADCTQEAL